MASRSRKLVELATGVKNNLSLQLSDSNSEIDISTQDKNENAKSSTNTLQTSTEGIFLLVLFFFSVMFLLFNYFNSLCRQIRRESRFHPNS